MLTTGLILLFATAGISAQEGESQSQAELQGQVRKLVRQLGSSEVAQRDAAEDGLLELGPPILDLLDEIPPQRDAEISTRLTRVREALYKQAVEAATAATTVSIDADGTPLSELLALIEKQTGNRIVDKRAEFGQEADDPKITLQLTDAPFWQALDAVLDEAELTTYNYSGEKDATALMARPLGTMPRAGTAAYSGVFRMDPTMIEAVRDLRNPTAAALKLTVEVSWEPRLTPISISQSLDALAVTNEDGEAIEIDGRLGSISTDVNSAIAATELEFPLVLPNRDVKKIASLEGKLSVMVPGRVEKFTFGKLSQADDDEQKRGSATIILQTVRKNNAVYEVRMVLRFDKAANALESHRGWVLNNKAYLLDGDGKQIEHAGYETIRQTPNEVGFGYKFVIDGDIDDHRFVYETPAAVVQKQIEYQLKDIPLP